MEITLQTNAGAATLTLRGRLDAAWSDPVNDAVQKALRDGFLDVRLELSGVPYISSAGIRVLLSQWKELRRAQGRLSITAVSTEVERILKLAGLGMLLEASVGPTVQAPTKLTVQPWKGKNFSGDVEEIAPGARWRGRLVGMPTAPLNLAQVASAPLASVKLPASTLALGFGALGNSTAGSADTLGELLAVGGCAVQLAANGENQADYAVTENALAPEAQLAQGLFAEGAFAKLVHFEVASDSSSIALSDLATSMLAASNAPQIAFAMVAEVSALVGACLRTPPNAAGADKIFDFPVVRDWLTFTAEPAYQNTVALVVGVASRPEAKQLANFTRPSGSNSATLLHAHAAVFHFRPLRHGRMVLAETATSLFEAGRVLGVLHLLNDQRPETGAGESRFYRGACWFGPLDI